ncbi:MAG: hypothetical protein ACOH16_03310 [Propionibacteriaceae bacterium]
MIDNADLHTKRSAVRGWLVFVVVAVVAISAGTITGRMLSTSNGGTAPSDTVLKFFSAVRDNNAKAALAELATPPTDSTFITDVILRTAHINGAISNIVVPSTDSTVVPVSYTLAGETVTDRISVEPVGNGYKISTSLNSGGISLKGKIRAGLPLSLAGTAVTSDTVILLPGSYPMTTVTDRLMYGSGSLVVKRLSDATTSNDLRLQLSSTGQTAALGAVTTSLDSCVAQKSFTPTGCPFKLTGAKADPSTVAWTLLSTLADDMKVTLSTTDLTRSTVEVPLKLRLAYTDGATPHTQELTPIAVGTVDLLHDSVTVTWQS